MRIKAFLVVLFLCSLQKLFAQSCFVADKRRGCPPLTVKLTLTDSCNTASQGQFNFGVSPPTFTVSDTFTYTSIGVYTVSFSANFLSGGATITKPGFIQVLATPPPLFTIQRCEGRVVRVLITSNVYEEYIVDYGDGSADDTIRLPQTLGPAHTYANVSPRTVTVRGRYVPGDCGITASQQVTPLNIIPTPTISLLHVYGDRALINFTTLPEVRYILYRGLGVASMPFDTILATANSFSYQVTNQPHTGGSWCYRVASLDGCNQQKSSDTLCAFHSVQVQALNDVNVLLWLNPASSLNSLQVIRTQPGIIAAFGMQPLPESYSDSMVICGQRFCYFLQGAVGSSIVRSDTVCTTAVSVKTPENLRRPTASVEGDGIVLRSALPSGIIGGKITAERFAFDRADTRITFPFLGQVTDGPFAQGVLERYCYTLGVSDTCGNVSIAPSRTCAVFLQGSGNEQTTRKLVWSPFIGYDTLNAFNYTVEKLSPEGLILRSISRGALLEYEDNDVEPGFQNITYRIRTTGPVGMPVVYSNAIVLKQRSSLYVPTAFSPNGDGINDEFFVQSKFLKQFRLVIYSKQGELLYQSTNPDERWNGTVMGRELPPDVYIFAIEARDENNKPFIEKGSITLLK